MRQQLAIFAMLIHFVRSRAALARAQGRNQLGASAVEWAIISALVVAMALIVYNAIEAVVRSRAGQISQGG
jgi:Flp pilus assembly pilin Flp